MEIICQEDIVVQGSKDGPLWHEKYEYEKVRKRGHFERLRFSITYTNL
jgi:hypothetical protein